MSVMKLSMKIFAVMAVALILIPCNDSCAAKSKRKSSKAPTPQSQAPKTSGINALVGVWKGEGTGAGIDPRQPGVDVSLNADGVVLTIESVKYSESEGEGRADVIFAGVITDIRGEVVCERTWEYSVPYDMRREGENSWSFSTEFVDGEDKITLSIMQGKNALIRWEGSVIQDENFPDEIYTFDVTCSAKKN